MSMRLRLGLRGVRGHSTVAWYAKYHALKAMPDIQRKEAIIRFSTKYGIETTTEAYNISKSTLLRWRRVYTVKGLEGLNDRSKKPKRVRSRTVHWKVKEAIIKIRNTYCTRKASGAVLTKYCASVMQECGVQYSPATLNRVIKDLKQQGKLITWNKTTHYVSSKTQRGTIHTVQSRPKRVKKRAKDHTHQVSDMFFQIDTVVTQTSEGRGYTVTAIDIRRKIAFAIGFTSPSSKNAAQFLLTLKAFCGGTITAVQTDNGSEFDKYFEMTCKAQGITHYHNYPRSPKMNACVERFNRTIQEEFIYSVKHLIRTDTEHYNRLLMEYLYFYNFKRPHQSLNLQTPAEFVQCEDQGTVVMLNTEKCHMY